MLARAKTADKHVAHDAWVRHDDDGSDAQGVEKFTFRADVRIVRGLMG